MMCIHLEKLSSKAFPDSPSIVKPIGVLSVVMTAGRYCGKAALFKKKEKLLGSKRRSDCVPREHCSCNLYRKQKKTQLYFLGDKEIFALLLTHFFRGIKRMWHHGSAHGCSCGPVLTAEMSHDSLCLLPPLPHSATFPTPQASDQGES